MTAGLVQRRGHSATMRSVLGDVRTAEVHLGDGFPWVNCPFCSQPVYLREPHPDHQDKSVGRNGQCSHGWCPANPKMPLDKAREIRGAEHLTEMEIQSRQRNHFLSMTRIQEQASDRMQALLAGFEECKKRGTCFHCWKKSGHHIKHRKGCTR